MTRWLLVLTLAGALACFGGWYPWATAPIFFATLLVALANRRYTFHFSRSFRAVDRALVAVLAALGVQLVPLPPSLMQVLSPHAARVRGTLRLDAVALIDTWTSLSVDPRATFQALLVYSSAVLIFWSARAAFATGGLRLFCRVLAFIGVVFSIEALVQRAVTPTLIYGYWPPYTPGAQPFGPFFNRNHSAAWLMMAIPLVAGYLAARVRTRTADVRERRRILQIIAVAGTPLIIVLGVMSVALSAALSRSAILGLAAAAVAGKILARDRVDSQSNRAGPVFVVGALALMFLLTTIDVEQWFQRLNSTLSQSNTSRITIWRETLPVIRDFWLTGTGAGTYSMVMLLYQQSVIPLPHLRNFAHFNQAHSHYFQVLSEGGLLLTLPVAIAVIAFARAAREALHRDRGEAMWIRVGATASLVAIATQSIWETALRMPANALLCATLAGIVLHRRETN
jgi:O-antigen ligase